MTKSISVPSPIHLRQRMYPLSMNVADCDCAGDLETGGPGARAPDTPRPAMLILLGANYLKCGFFGEYTFLTAFLRGLRSFRAYHVSCRGDKVKKSAVSSFKGYAK